MTTSNRGVQFVYYTQNLPSRSVPIAQVSTAPASPAELTDVNNTVYNPGALTASMNVSPYTVFTAPALQVPVPITGSLTYLFANQFFELTDQIDTDSNPLYYQHPLPTGVTTVTILDLNGNTVPSGYVVRTLTRGTATNNYLLHSFPNVNNTVLPFVAYQVRYIDPQGFLHLELLKFYNVYAKDPFNATAATYTTQGIQLTVNSDSTIYYIRWFAQNGYQVIAPYGDVANDPWYARIRFNPLPPPPEYGTQVWTPQRPQILATWVPGTVLGTHIVQMERPKIYFVSNLYPDLLVYDSNNVLKYALAGKTGNGFLFPWRLNQFVDIDPSTGVLQVAVELDPTDIVYGFYSYEEDDVVFRGLDLNPYTNPSVRNRVIEFYQKTNGIDPLHYLYYTVLNEDGSTFSTNDPAPNTGTNHLFGTVLVGQSTSVGDFTFVDARVRGGGLAPLYQSIPQAVNFWDLGFWDGKPFPAGGAMIIYLPVTVQNTFTAAEVSQIIGAVVPMGTVPVIIYYDSQGNETV
jgi:hypothetical protein